MATDNDAQENAATSPQHVVLDDLELRPPLPSVGADVLSLDRSSLHPLLCRMFVAAQVLKLSNEARFSSLILLHRYFDAQQKSVDWKWIAAACLFLGTKTEEESRRLRDILNVADMLEFSGTQTDKSKGSESLLEIIHVKEKPMLLDEDYWTAKEQLVATEQKVLRMLQFDVCVSHPHRAVAVLLSEVDIENKQEILPVSWSYLNQALFYAPALRHDVLTLACASIECARTSLTEGNQESIQSQWWLRYKVSDNSLQQCITELHHSVTL